MVSQEKVAFLCDECFGNKNLATKASWTAHMKSYHPKVLQAQANLDKTTTTNSTSTTTTSTTTPAPINTSTISPSTSTSVLQTPATLVPVTPAFDATSPEPAHPQNDLTDNDEEDLNMEDDVMESWAEVQESIDKVMQAIVEPETEQDNKDDLNEKVKRFKAIVEKKNVMVQLGKETKKKLEQELKLTKEVNEKQHTELEEKTSEIETLKKKIREDSEQVNESMKISDNLKNLEKDLEELRSSNNEILKQKNNLEIENSTKDFIIKEIKKVMESKEQNEEEIVVLSEGNSGVQMDKNLSGNICNFCEKSFRNNRDLDRHIQDKHERTESHSEGYECTLCGDGFTREAEFNNHVLQCIKRTIHIVQCPSCKNNFATGALKKHIQKGKCSPKATGNGMRNHPRADHRDESRSKTVCRHWKRGNCLKGDTCMFAHVGFQDNAQAKHFITRNASVVGTPPNSKTSCRNGQSCVWLAQNRCNYLHKDQNQPLREGHLGHQGGWQVQRGQQGGHQRGQLGGQQPLSDSECWYQERCRRPACHFNHNSLSDFPNLPNPRNKRIPNNNVMNNQ